MEPLALLDRPHLLLAAALTAAGVWMASGARPAWKRAAGLAVAHMGPMALLASGAPAGAEVAAAAGLMGLAYLVLGLALSVRLREAYGTLETDEIDAQDDASLMPGPPP